MDLIFFAFLALVIIPAFCNRNSSDDYLSVAVTTDVRGIAAIGIVLHHMSERIMKGWFFSKLGMVGYLLVTLFFFLSGYGLMVQYVKKQERYLDGFLRKRVLYLAVVYLLDILLYAVVGNALGKGYTLAQVAKAYFVGGVAANTWYMVVQILLYLVFYFVFRSRAIRPTGKKIVVMFAFQTAFWIACIMHGASSVWYLSNYGFSLGMLWGYKKDAIDRVLTEKYWPVLLASFMAFALFYGVPVISDRVLPDSVAVWVRMFCRLISSPLSVVLLLVLLFRIQPKSRLWSALGEVSLEIYLLHGLVYSLLRSSVIYVESGFLWTILTVGISVAIAFPVHKLNTKIETMFK